MTRPLLLGFTLLCGTAIHPAFASDMPPTSETEASGLFETLDRVYGQTSLYTTHFSPKPEHNNQQDLINLELHWESRAIAGFSWFRNSFDQPSQFVYGGYQWDIPHTRQILYFNPLAGFLHGYKGEHKEAIPLNDAGVAPGILPVLGARYQSVNSQIILFGTAGLMVTLGYEFDLAP